jgi:hypothetical protein
MTLTEERHAIEARHPGWHVWTSDAGKTWATKVSPHAVGATVAAPFITEMDRIIAEEERRQGFEAALVRAHGGVAA